MKSAWTGLNTLLTSEGKVGWVQPIGADPRRNFNAESWESFGAGSFLLGLSGRYQRVEADTGFVPPSQSDLYPNLDKFSI